MIHTEEGIAQNNGGTYTYHYNLSDHLGNVRYTFDIYNGAVRMLQRDDYYAFGLRKSIPNDIGAVSVVNKYLYNGKELQDGLEQYDYGARFYDPVIGKFNTIDPLSEVSRRNSPYNYALNNPIRFIDVDGMYAASPIFDKDGNFLGTDDEGLKGKDIVMKREDFKQGMSHKEAVKKDLGVESLDLEATRNWYSFSKTIESRPDYDGKLTLDEANKWYQTGGGKPLFVDAAKVDLLPVEKSDFSKVGDSFYKNFAFTSNTETGLLYGNIKLTLMNDKGVIKLGGAGGVLDKYDFDYKSGAKNIPRNIATWIGEQKAGKGTGFTIYNYGTGRVK